MTQPAARTAGQRKADTLAKLRASAADVWVASAANGDGAAEPYLVPLSLAWIGERVVIALELGSRTARNIRGGGSARLALGPTRDVVVIDAVLDESVPLDGAPTGLADRFAAQADWDPRRSPGEYVYLVLRPVRVQAWREADELAGRTLMRDGSWLV
ncbi:MAG: pyridoxamine 5'-phosphate oxidase family protein [Actinomycetes bacterium]